METKQTSFYLTGSGLITGKPAQLISILVRSNASGVGVATVYNGANTTGKILLDISALTSDSKKFSPPEPLQAENGIFVSFGTYVASATVVYKHI